MFLNWYRHFENGLIRSGFNGTILGIFYLKGPASGKMLDNAGVEWCWFEGTTSDKIPSYEKKKQVVFPSFLSYLIHPQFQDIHQSKLHLVQFHQMIFLEVYDEHQLLLLWPFRLVYFP